MKTLHEIISECRTSRNVTISEIAKESGVSFSTVQRLAQFDNLDALTRTDRAIRSGCARIMGMDPKPIRTCKRRAE